MMSCVVAPLWKDRSSSAVSRACTAWTNGIVGHAGDACTNANCGDVQVVGTDRLDRGSQRRGR